MRRYKAGVLTMARTIYRDPQTGKMISKKRAAELGLNPPSSEKAVKRAVRRRVRGRLVTPRRA